MKVIWIVSNIKLIKYLTLPPYEYFDMLVEHKLNHVSLKLINPFKKTSRSIIIIIGKKEAFQLMGYPSKTQQCMSMLFDIIQ